MFFITQNPDVSDKSRYFRYNKKVEYMRLSFAYTTAKQMKRTYGRDRSGGVEAVPKRSEGMSREDGEVWIARPLRLQSSRGGNANLLFLRRFRLF